MNFLVGLELSLNVHLGNKYTEIKYLGYRLIKVWRFAKTNRPRGLFIPLPSHSRILRFKQRSREKQQGNPQSH